MGVICAHLYGKAESLRGKEKLMKINDVFEHEKTSYQIKRFDREHLYASKMELKDKDGKQTLVAVKGRPRKFTKAQVAELMGVDLEEAETTTREAEPSKTVTKTKAPSSRSKNEDEEALDETTGPDDIPDEPVVIQTPKRDPAAVKKSGEELARSLGLENVTDEDW